MAERPNYGIAGLRDNRKMYWHLEPEAKAFKLAEIEACPVAVDLIARNGAKAMIGRYARVIYWFDHCRQVITQTGREDLALSLVQPKQRLIDEPLGEHSADWLPADSDKVAHRSASAYFIGRLFNTYLTQKDQTQRLNKLEADEALRQAAAGATSEVELLVNFAENLANLNAGQDIKPEDLLKRQIGLLTRVLGLGKLSEDNQLSEYGQIAQAVAACPTLGAVYKNLKPQQLDELKIYSPERVERFLSPADFGRGGELPKDPAVGLLCPVEKLRITAWRHACPRPGMVAKEYGVEWTMGRYEYCNDVYRRIVELAIFKNPQLAEMLVAMTPRSVDEPVGVFEEGRVPQNYVNEMPPLSTLTGYALPRVLNEAMLGMANTTKTDEHQETEPMTAWERMRELVSISKTPMELTARTAQMAQAEFGADVKTLLSHLLPQGILEEQNNRGEFRQMVRALGLYAPDIVFELGKYLIVDIGALEEAGVVKPRMIRNN